MLHLQKTDPRMPALWASLLAGAVCGAALIFFGREAPVFSPDALYIPPDWTGFLSGALSAFGRGLFWLTAAAFAGFSVLGAPALWALPFWRGLGDGYLAGALLRTGWAGLPAAMRVLCPGLLTAMLLLESCSESMQQSVWLVRCVTRSKAAGGNRGLQGFLARYTGLLLLLALCACADAGAAVACGLLAA